ncbi:hypothetical protein ACLOJK_032841 [Asimina triloba]
MASQAVKVRKETLAACMTCPLCDKLLREATTISECLHTYFLEEILVRWALKWYCPSMQTYLYVKWICIVHRLEFVMGGRCWDFITHVDFQLLTSQCCGLQGILTPYFGVLLTVLCTKVLHPDPPVSAMYVKRLDIIDLKCIYDKLNDEELDCCPMCNIDLGCTPVEKLRPDHNLQDVRAKIFPLKRRKVKAPEVTPSVTLPIRRKERSLSSLVVITPRVSTQTGLTGRRTKSVARKAAAPRGSSFAIEESIKKEEDVAEDKLESSSSPETLNKIAQNKRQHSSSAEPSNHATNKDTENGNESIPGKIDLWKPLNCLVEAANRTKSYRFTIQGGSVTKTEQPHTPNSEAHVPRKKTKEQIHKARVQDDKNEIASAPAEQLVKARKLHKISRKRRAASGELGSSAQALLNASGIRRERRVSPIWFSLMVSDEQEGETRLPQISACYLRIKDGNVPVSFIQKYLAKKLDLTCEAEVEIRFLGQVVTPATALHNVVDTWLRMAPTAQKMAASVGTSAKEFVMVLNYALKPQAGSPQP